MADTIIPVDKFNIKTLKYGPPKPNESGGKSYSILNVFPGVNGNPPNPALLRFETPTMRTYGVSDFEGNKKYNVALQFPDADSRSEDINLFLQNIQALEKKVKHDAFLNQQEWLGSNWDIEAITDALFTPMLKYPKDKTTKKFLLDRAPALHVKLPIWKDVYQCEVYNVNGKKLFPNNDGLTPLELIPKNSNVACIIQCGGIWVASGKYGVTWRLSQIVVQEQRPGITGQCLIRGIKPDDQQLLQTALPEPDLADEHPFVSTVTVSDSDDEEEDDEVYVPPPTKQVAPTPDPTPTPAPAPAIVKEEVKVAVKRVADETDEEPAKKKKVVKKKVGVSEST